MENKQDLVGFVGPSNEMRSSRFDDQRTVNLYVEVTGAANAKGNLPAVMLGTPGLQQMFNVGSGPIRQLYVPRGNPGMMFIVSGNEVYRIDGNINTGAPVLLSGHLSTSSGPVSMSDNGLQAFIVDGVGGYYVTLATPGNVYTVNDVHFYPASSVTFQDGYFVFVAANTQYVFQSNLYDISFPSLNQAAKSGAADNTVAAISNNRQLYVFGTSTTEIWWDAGQSSATPFMRQDGKFMSYGCASSSSIAQLDNTIFWLGTTGATGAGQVFMLQNDSATRISTHAIETLIQSSSNLNTATAYAYQEEGHFFYVLNLPGVGTTLVYDAITGLWHERQFMNNGIMERHRGNCHAYFAGAHIVGDYANGKIYWQNLAFYTDGNLPIVRIRQSPHVSNEQNRLFYKLFEVDLEFGVGLTQTATTPGNAVSPTVLLEISNDGGKTWGQPRGRQIGAIGKYRGRARWSLNGAARDRVFRITITDPVKVAILSAQIDFEVGKQ